MTINIYRGFEVMLFDLELIINSLVIVKCMGVFGPGGDLKFDAKNVSEVRY